VTDSAHAIETQRHAAKADAAFTIGQCSLRVALAATLGYGPEAMFTDAREAR